MSIVILIILIFLLIENTMIMFMIAALVNNKNKPQEYTESEVQKINRDIEQKKFNIFAEYMMNGYDKYDANKNFVDSHSTK